MFTSVFDAPLNARYRSNEYPALTAQTERWSQNRPLAGLTVLDATPVYFNTFAKYRALTAAGARLTVGISEVMPNDPKALAWLRENGIPVADARAGAGSFDLILDCAAAFIQSTARIGTVELTRSGVPHYRNPAHPVFIADGGRIKRIETCLGTGESFYRAMAQKGFTDWAGKHLVVFGSGKVGTGLITYAHKLGAVISVVTEPASVSARLKALAGITWIAFNDKAGIEKAVGLADVVVTATGVAGAATHFADAKVFTGSKALLANMGVEDEYGAGVPDNRVLEEKRPLNFILAEPTLMKYIDATMALHNAGALWLTEHPEARGVIDPPAELEAAILADTRAGGLLGDELDLI